MDRKRPSRFKTLRAQAAALMDDRTLALRGEGRLSWPQRWVHFWVLVGRGFVRNRCPVRASALAYTTLLALIPLLAVGLGVSTGLLKGSELRAAEFIRNLVDQVAPQLDLLPVGREEKRRRSGRWWKWCRAFCKARGRNRPGKFKRWRIGWCRR